MPLDSVQMLPSKFLNRERWREVNPAVERVIEC